jgi:hypothetical protein
MIWLKAKNLVRSFLTKERYIIMTEEQKQVIISELIQTAPLYSETRTWYAEFTYFTIDIQRWENDLYILNRTNNWVETYNNQGEMGGWSNVGSTDVLEVKEV